jgi:hypothetical protein
MRHPGLDVDVGAKSEGALRRFVFGETSVDMILLQPFRSPSLSGIKLFEYAELVVVRSSSVVLG